MNKTGITFLIVAALVALYALYLPLSADIRPFESSLNLETGETIEGSFEVNHDDTYMIWLQADYVLESNRQKCLMEMVWPPFLDECNGVESVIHLTWELDEDGKLIKIGDSKDYRAAHFGNRWGTGAGAFKGEKGKVYTLRVSVEKDAPELASTNPGILVRGDPLRPQGAAMASFIYLVLAGAIGGVGIVIMGIGKMIKNRKRRAH